MANLRALLLIASLLVAAVALSGADARPTVRPDKTVAALPDADDVHGRGLAEAPMKSVANPECDDEDKDDESEKKKKKKKKKEEHDKDKPDHADAPSYAAESPNPATTTNAADSPNPSTTSAADSPNPLTTTTDSLEQVLCESCEVPPPPPEPACNPCEEPKEPGLMCKKVHAVQDGETCDAIGKCAELGHDDFLKLNPNICCDHLFVGQWVCLEAECSEESH